MGYPTSSVHSLKSLQLKTGASLNIKRDTLGAI